MFNKLYENKKNDEAEKITNFEKLCKHCSHPILRRARNALIRKKNSVSRLSSDQLKSEQTSKLMNSIYTVMDTPDFTTRKGFRQVQDTFFTCRTVTDARRSGEAARMTIKAAEEGLEDRWLPENMTDYFQEIQKAVKLSRTAYVPVKGQIWSTNVLG